MLRTCVCVILVLLEVIQTYADPGRYHGQTSPKTWQWDHDWAHAWGQHDWFSSPHTTRVRARKTTSNEFRQTMETAETVATSPSTAVTPPQPVIRDVEIRIKEDPTDVSNATPTRQIHIENYLDIQLSTDIGAIDDVSTARDVTAAPTSITKPNDTPQTDNTGDKTDKPFNIQEEPIISEEENTKHTNTNIQEGPTPITLANPLVDTPSRDAPIVIDTPSQDAPVVIDTPSRDAPIVIDTPSQDAPVVIDTPSRDAPIVIDTPSSDAPVLIDTPSRDAPVVIDMPSRDAPVVIDTPSPDAPVVIDTPSRDAPVVIDTPSLDAPVIDSTFSHWHVGIYRRTEMPYTQICGGSLIKTDMVISAAHCFWTFETKLQPTNQFAAAAGKTYRDWDDPRDMNAQYSDIKYMVITQMFRPCLGPDLALLTLATPFRFVGAVKPVCIELAEKESLTTGDKGLIAGWAEAAEACNPSERLTWSTLPFVHTLNCSSETEIFNDWANKICAGDSKSKTQCETDSGSGLVFFNNTTPYLRGIATFVPDDSLCFIYSTPSFTPAGRGYQEFNNHFELLLKSINPSECTDFYSANQFQNQTKNEVSIGGQQLPSNEVGNDTQISQSQTEPSNFDFTVLPEEENIVFNALATGSEPVPMLNDTNAPAYQWHVGIYSKAFNPFMQICGGSLVKLDVVISAAHCFWTDEAGPQPASQFAVAGGKLYRPWNNARDTYAQLSDVSEITIPVRFRGETTSFQDDIAVVRLASPFSLAPGVAPACVNFGEALERQQLVRGNPGTVAGWGLTEENGTPSQRLNYLELPYVEIGDCYNTSQANFLKYITSDKICAGDQSTGKALCRGDSGGGLILFSETTPYLRGVASTAPNNNNLCNAFAIATFTQIYAHRTFLRDNIPDVDKGCILDPTGNSAESGMSTGNGAERVQFSTGNGINVGADEIEATGNGVVTTTEKGFTIKPPVFVQIAGPTAANPKVPSTKFEHSHLVPYNNFICNCNCKN